jgi:hypothetical protein
VPAFCTRLPRFVPNGTQVVRDRGRLRTTLTWAVLAAATTAALCTVDVLPFYDYYLWLFQGHVVSALLFDGGPAPVALDTAYHLSPVPVPNLAAPLLIGLLNAWLPVETAGLVFVVATVLGFATAYGFLVRTLQQRQTWVEYTGFLWALGFFLYKGYLSYVVGVALVFVLIAVLHRPTQAKPWVVAALGVALYLSHLIAWAIGMLAVAVHAVELWRDRRRVDARDLALSALPGVALLGWYAVAERGGSGLSLYTTWTNKLISLGEPLLFFLRLDPFPPTFPVFVANLAVGLAVLGMAVHELDRAALRTALRERPVLWLSGALALVALAVPVDELNDLIKPDERFVLPAVVLALAALPYRTLRPATGTVVVGLVAAVVGLHAIEYAEVAPQIAAVDAATDAFVPIGAPVLQLTVPSHRGCAPAPGLSIGVPALKWFGVDRVIETGAAVVRLDETSIVHARPGTGQPDLTALAPPTRAEATAVALTTVPQHPYVLLVACADDLEALEQDLAPAYAPAAHGVGFTLLSRRS